MLGPSTVELHERVDDLRDSRARILAAADDERRRIERDLHDGAQQRLVSLTLTLGLAEGRCASDPDTAGRWSMRRARRPSAPSRSCASWPAASTPRCSPSAGWARRWTRSPRARPSPWRSSGVPDERLPAAVEAALYFTTAEALTNVAKYAPRRTGPPSRSSASRAS